MSWAGALAPWLVLMLVAVAVAAAATMPAALAARRLRMAGIALFGGLAVAATAWQQRSAADRISRLTEQVHSASLTKQVNVLEDQIKKLKQSTRLRTISADTAAQLADYLRPFGPHQVVVSCAPDDIEAYRYATEIVNILKSADWGARGPETTTIFGHIKSMAINVYDAGSGQTDTTKILLAGLAKFSIPYQSRVPPGEALPDHRTVELFIGAKPSPPAAAEATP